MRDLKKNQRKLWYSLYEGKKPILDEFGDETVDYEVCYTKPKQFSISLSAGHGSVYSNVFGADIDYSRTIMTTDMKLPITETSLVWYETKPIFNEDGTVDESSADYEVSAPPASGLDVLVIALKKRKTNG